jgi:hypothetical protein
MKKQTTTVLCLMLLGGSAAFASAPAPDATLVGGELVLTAAADLDAGRARPPGAPLPAAPASALAVAPGGLGETALPAAAPLPAVTIDVATLIPGGDNHSGSGWSFQTTGTNVLTQTNQLQLYLGYACNFILTGSIVNGVKIHATGTPAGTITIDRLTADIAIPGLGFPALWLEPGAGALTVYVKNTNELSGGSSTGGGIGYLPAGSGTLILDLAPGALLNTRSAAAAPALAATGTGADTDALLITGVGTLNALANTAPYYVANPPAGGGGAGSGVYVDGPLAVTGSVTLNAVGAGYDGAWGDYDVPRDGIRADTLALAGVARVRATGGDYIGTGALAASATTRYGGNGVTLLGDPLTATLENNSSAPGALVATGGSTTATGSVPAGFGNGIAAPDAADALVLTGTGVTAATGARNGLYAGGNLEIRAGQITATARGASDYALYSTGTITITGGATTVTATNTIVSANIYHGMLNDPGHKLNATGTTTGTGGNGNNNNNNTGGGSSGGGGAPTLPALALIALLAVLRARKNARE